MGFRSLAQVLLGIFGFVLMVELFTAVDDGIGAVFIGGVGVRPLLLVLLLIADIGAIVAVRVSGRGPEKYRPRGAAPMAATRCECTECGWTDGAPTIEQAGSQRQQHLHEVHGGPTATP